MGDSFGLLITTFINDTGKLVNSLSELQQQNNLKMFIRNAHSIKSSSANVGALQLSLIAADLEIQGESGDISNASTLIERLKTEFADACNELGAANQPSAERLV
ncbi:hypothetical protein MNBD_GAMMA24-876 [hydrothermal vent metagenome]|uniref:HPt domain-containing protein n=1 Tax=hydrothermal vent metagenome TaxID=652676 RepID=A0A3B1BSN7_9ZZZZ